MTPDVAAFGAATVIRANETDAGQRLHRVPAQHLPLLSRTRLKRLIETGQVTHEGAVLRDPSLRVRYDQNFVVILPEVEDAAPVAQPIALDVRFEDAHLIVIDKPAGMVVHPAPGNPDGTLVNALLAHGGASLSGIGGVRRPGIVHRLDKDTSGLIVVAKTDAAHQGLAALFADHGRTGALVREYLAIAWGAFDARAGRVDAPLGRHPRQREKMAVVGAGRGRSAVTHWRVEELLGPATLVTCRLETGRTHQIRVHLAHIGHPLLGDSVYGAAFKTKAARLEPTARAALLTLGRQALHAAILGFDHPLTGESLLFQSPAPVDFATFLEALRS